MTELITSQIQPPRYSEWSTFKVPPIGSLPVPLLQAKATRGEAHIVNTTLDAVDQESSSAAFDSKVPHTFSEVLADLGTLSAGIYQIIASIDISGRVKADDDSNVSLVVGPGVVMRYIYSAAKWAGIVPSQPAFTAVIPPGGARVQLRTAVMPSGKGKYHTSLLATRSAGLSGSSPIVVSDKQETLKIATPSGLTLVPGKSLRLSNQQAAYAIALTAEVTVSVLDQW